METTDKNVNDVLLLFKTKVQEAIYLIEGMPDDTRRDVWQFWKEVSKIVKTTTRPRPVKLKRKSLQIKSEPDTEENRTQEIELSILHLEESVDNQDDDVYNDASGLPIAFTHDLDSQIPENRTNSFVPTSNFQNSYTVKNETGKVDTEMVSSSVVSSEVVSSSFTLSSNATEVVSSSGTVTSLVHSPSSVSPATSSGNSSYVEGNSRNTHEYSTDVGASISEIVFEDSSSLLSDTKPKTCELYTTDGTNAILLSAEVPNKPVEQIKRKRGRPRKIPTNDISETHVVKSLPSTGMKILSVRPKRVRKAAVSSIYCYPSSKRKNNVAGDDEDWSDADSDTQQKHEHRTSDSINDHLGNNDSRDDDHSDDHNDDQTDGRKGDGNDADGEMGDKENEESGKAVIRRRRKKTKTGYSYEPGPVDCPECGVQLAYSSSLTAHMRKHTGARPFKCRHCDKAFTTKANMIRHELTHTGERPYQCPLCDKAFTEARSLAVHNRTHTGEKPYVCKICNASFRQRGTLQAHIYCHTGHKGHLCDLCGKAFRQKTQLREHQKRHSKNKSVKCEVCGKMFYGKGDLYRHSLQHSGVRPYQCSLCEKTFTRLQYLREHTNVHTGHRPYACADCSVAFHDLASLYRHRIKHKKPNDEKKPDINTVDLSEVVIVNNAATDEVLQSLIAEAAGSGHVEITQSTGNQLQEAAQSILSGSSPVTQVYQITYVDEDNTEIDTGVRHSEAQLLTNVDFSAINLLANATQLSLSQ